ncbi:N-acetyl-beta-glucosaminyl-glycoprotein 4-beta-N-acetylgalactosaminyltransferase 1 [Trichoplax sp. H2]|nr:N-acetyl-beta-glucosaminyl-glycoprotein 4-beta-N-acetylgalactosaminyltransferase 1 [Trichoplax sp. H2]|eukprot:RDD45505.1 N-acetyl-beta-glucosaminyl-glycoprotein 4-beta-N-acetylgalactosaminyltransferase 1 [Trichoplax sp. H2]
MILLNGDTARRCSPQLNKAKALAIVNRASNRTYKLIKIIEVEEKINDGQGKRYYIELLLKRYDSHLLWRVSDYLYLSNQNSQLCKLIDMEWHQRIHVYVVIIVQQQGQWIKYFLNQVSRYYIQSHDEYFSIIIVDFGSTDINIRDELDRSPLKKFKIIQLGKKYPKFIKTIGLNTAIEAIDDPNSIILIFDLHFNFPMDILDNARKRCFKGKTAYTPIILRLNCYATPSHPNGFREIFGYGILAMYKYDFKRTGGYDSVNYREQWGGEDVQMVNSIFTHNLDVERVCHPTLYHHYHRSLPWKLV